MLNNKKIIAMTNKINKINFQENDFLFFGKKNQKAEFIELNPNSINTADRLVTMMVKYCVENDIKNARFDTQYADNGMVMIYCKEDVDETKTNVYLVAVVDGLLWWTIGWEDTKFTVEIPDDLDDVVVSDEIIGWQRRWRQATIDLHTKGKGLSKEEQERLVKEHEND